MEPLNDEIEVLDLNSTDENKEQKTEKKHSKKYKYLIITICILIAIGIIISYYLTKNNNQIKYLKRKIEVASTDYFEKYMSTNDSASAYIVTLNMLKDANDRGENYDLKGLENCKNHSTLAIININYKDGKPKKVEVELNC